jgi:2'-5' RNA ligase
MYFIALVAPDEINKQVLKWKQLMFDRFNCSVALRSPAHITLIPPFWMNPELEAELQESIRSFAELQNVFEIELQNFSFFKPSVIFVEVIKNDKLQQLHENLTSYLIDKNFNIKKDERPFHPHVTIAARDVQKKVFYEVREIFKDKKYYAHWQADCISILRHNKKNWDVIAASQFQSFKA